MCLDLSENKQKTFLKHDYLGPCRDAHNVLSLTEEYTVLKLKLMSNTVVWGCLQFLVVFQIESDVVKRTVTPNHFF